MTSVLVTLLTIAGDEDQAMAAAEGLVERAEATRNPYALSLALLAYGFAWRNADPSHAREAMQRGLSVAHESGNRFNESHLTANLAQLDVERGDPLSALEHIGLAIRHLHDSGNTVTVRSPLTNLAILLDKAGRYESAATIAGFAFTPLTAASFPHINTTIAHLRQVLGDQVYGSLARKGEAMTTAAMVMYAYDQIDQARTELNALSDTKQGT
jgi:tetratricopeptide (TPR) repeat protein